MTSIITFPLITHIVQHICVLCPFEIVSRAIIQFGGTVAHQRFPQRGACLKDEAHHAADQNWIAYRLEENY